MTVVSVHTDESGIPLVRLSGPASEASGAELAATVMRAIHYHTEDSTKYLHPLSLVAPCTSAPHTWV